MITCMCRHGGSRCETVGRLVDFQRRFVGDRPVFLCAMCDGSVLVGDRIATICRCRCRGCGSIQVDGKTEYDEQPRGSEAEHTDLDPLRQHGGDQGRSCGAEEPGLRQHA